MPRKSKKKKLRKDQLPPEADWTKPEPLKKDDLFIRMMNQSSPIRRPQRGSTPAQLIKKRKK
jgi:hypothetical protein